MLHHFMKIKNWIIWNIRVKLWNVSDKKNTLFLWQVFRELWAVRILFQFVKILLLRFSNLYFCHYLPIITRIEFNLLVCTNGQLNQQKSFTKKSTVGKIRTLFATNNTYKKLGNRMRDTVCLFSVNVFVDYCILVNTRIT